VRPSTIENDSPSAIREFVSGLIDPGEFSGEVVFDPSYSDNPLVNVVFDHEHDWQAAQARDVQGFPESKQAARAGGTVAGNARRELERILASARVSHLHEVCREPFLGLGHAAYIHAIRARLQVLRLVSGTDRHKAEIARVGVGGLPEFHRGGFILAHHTN
jgi:hypothetical protein